MTRTPGVALTAGILLAATVPEPAAMTRDKAIYGHVSHVGWVVKDVEAVSAAWRGFGVIDLHDDGVREVPVIDRGRSGTLRFRRVTARMGAHAIHWIQPLGGSDQLAEFLERHGEGVHHIAFAVPSGARLDEEVKALSAAGAPVVQEASASTAKGNARFVYLDTATRGGGIMTELEHDPGASAEPPSDASASAQSPAGRNQDPFNRITQFAFVVGDIEAVSAYWAGLGLGGLSIDRNVSLDRVYREKPGRFEMLLGWNRNGDVPFEWIQPLVGPSVYEEYVAAHHEGLHHLGFNVRDMDAAIARLRTAGLNVTMSGAWDSNGHQGRFAYLDAERHGGVTIELLWNKPR
jgi:catechol 2,3-dioxygenase-like lactoylglutathione lyase family enzyme